MNIPEELKYTKDHEWISIEGDVATVGITDFAQRELGDIVYVEVETVGETLEADEVFGTVEAVKTVSDLFLPVAGEIIEFNKDILAIGCGDFAVEVTELCRTGKNKLSIKDFYNGAQKILKEGDIISWILGV